jgi:hypothetical protein
MIAAVQPSAKAESSDEEDDEDDDIDLERDDQGNYIVFKPSNNPDDGDGADEAEEEEELSEKFMSLKSTKQVQILLVTLKTQIFHAQEQEVKVGYLKKQYGEISQKLVQAKSQLQAREVQLAQKLKELEEVKNILYQKDFALR